MPELISVESDLEKWFKKSLKGSPKLPRRGGKYFEHYTSIKQRLADKYYSVTGAALAQEGGGRYTKHDIGHVDDVIETAGLMLGLGLEGVVPAAKHLSAYECFVLLVAILLHDAGNAIRRKGHEKKAAEILREVGEAVGLSAIEHKMIASIAQAHGGEMEDGDKETITRILSDPIPSIQGIEVHARRLAALLRLADELSENHTRADEVALESEATPHLSILANLYCRAINRKIDFGGKSIHLEFTIDKSLLSRSFTIPDKDLGTRDILFVDYIAERLEKCESERRYCNRFLSGFATYDRIRAKLVIMNGDHEIDTVVVDLEEVGYPSVTKKVREIQPNFDACKLRDLHCELPHQEKIA